MGGGNSEGGCYVAVKDGGRKKGERVGVTSQSKMVVRGRERGWEEGTVRVGVTSRSKMVVGRRERGWEGGTESYVEVKDGVKRKGRNIGELGIMPHSKMVANEYETVLG